jgi:DNA-binding NtrC family response regulator
MSSLLIIEQDEQWRNFLADSLAGAYQISYCSAGRDISQKIQLVHFDIVLLDLADGDSRLLAVLAEVKRLLPFTPVVVTCSAEKAELVVSAIRLGAFDFIVKPYTAAKIKVSLDKALENVSLRNEINFLRREQDVIYDVDKIIAYSKSMQRVIADIRKFSATDSTILMTGETGTGKSLLAGSIHYNSLRRGKPFVTINCANIQETLLESELFGHEKGSFTGADKLRIGRFEQANGGSIFLDEIGELSLALQAKLLRVIAQKSFERVGGNRTINSDVRIISATNKDLEALVAQGRFREDLFYRINVLPIRLPPLRERQECLAPLANFLLDKIGRSMHKQVAGFSEQVIVAINAYPWPGNIRQLANTIERALLLEDGPAISRESFILPSETRPHPAVASSLPTSGEQNLAASEKETIIAVLEKTLWIQKDAAVLLGISPRVLNHKIKKLGIVHPRWRCHR